MAAIALGNSDFQKIRQGGGLYVDKTDAVADLISGRSELTLFCRPRRFGKTSFLSTIRYFLEQSEEDRSALFSDLQIWKRAEVMAHFQKYPVVWLSFKEVRGRNWGEAWEMLRRVLEDALEPFRSIPGDHAASAADWERLRAWKAQPIEAAGARRFLLELSSLLERCYGQKVVVLIDEYDTPIHTAWNNDYYEQMVDFFRAFLGNGLKDNSHLQLAVLTGVLRVAREGLFSSLNNIAVRSVLDGPFASAFGFTESEVQWLVEQSGVQVSLDQLRSWYNGYQIGKKCIYNPWSILACLAAEGDHGPYWVNTGSTEIIEDLVWNAEISVLDELGQLLSGEPLRRLIPDVNPLPGLEPIQLRALLLHTGYLTLSNVERQDYGWEADIRVPNRDVRSALYGLIHRWLSRAMPGDVAVMQLGAAMLAGREERFAELLGALVLRAMSFHDLRNPDPERVFHAFMLGLLLILEKTHQIWSNPESGLGRADALLTPRQSGGVGVILEFKKVEEEKEAEAALEKALKQVEQRRYDLRLREAGVATIRTYAIVFCGKKVFVKMAGELR